jgi:Kef-type K+ transport system membrane component KefB
MQHDPIVFTIFLIFAGAALFATLALYARQSLLVVYILLGILLGPSVLNLVSDPKLITDISHIGIIFLLFLLGVNLQPQKLIHIFRTSLIVTTVSSLAFLVIGTLVAVAFGFIWHEAVIIGSAMMFSSTIIGLKLLPTTVLHHKHMGELIIGVLLLQDILAIVILMLLPADWTQGFPIMQIVKLLVSLVALVIFAWVFERFVLIRLIARFDRIQEYIFLMAIGWCLSMAELAVFIGLSAEIGAFIGGIVLATNPIALYIGESLKPLRDFFLVIFFVALGASFDLGILQQVLLPATIMAIVLLLVKPFAFAMPLGWLGEDPARARETGTRLGQISEFSIFIAVLALELGVISARASYLIQVSTLITFLVSSWYIVLNYPSPIAVSDKLRRD